MEKLRGGPWAGIVVEGRFENFVGGRDFLDRRDDALDASAMASVVSMIANLGQRGEIGSLPITSSILRVEYGVDI